MITLPWIGICIGLQDGVEGLCIRRRGWMDMHGWVIELFITATEVGTLGRPAWLAVAKARSTYVHLL